MNKRMRHLFLAVVCLSLPFFTRAQSPVWRDTLPQALKIERRNAVIEVGKVKTDITTLQRVISPLGEGDAIKYIQTLPGVSTGAEGSSAFFVRGGNMGNNLMTLDGVPLYGLSHLLGLTSAIPSEAIRSMEFQVGGFDGSRRGLLSSHIQLQSIDPGASQAKINAFASNFLVGAGADIPLSDKTGLVVAGRISPLQLEYKAVKNLLPQDLALQDFGAGVFDLYSKLNWTIKPGMRLSAWVFSSRDNYRFQTTEANRQSLGWSNVVGAVQYHAEHGSPWVSDASLSFNSYENQQQLEVLSGNNTTSSLKMKSQLQELTLEGKWARPVGDRFTATVGAQGVLSVFNPGASSIDGVYVNQRSVPWTTTFWAQGDWKETDRYRMMVALRGNLFHSDKQFFFRPELSFLAEARLSSWLAINITADRLVQFYHTLEGIPLGWSTDLMVPADAATPPETAWQGYLGLRGHSGPHSLSVGAYYKQMQNLVYYTEAAAIFSGARSGWKDNIEVGKGRSYGMELFYDYSGERLYGKISYTLSKTTREFSALNDGLPFPAKYDRPHILNTDWEWILSRMEGRLRGINAAFTLQSGHCESVKAFSYPTVMPYGEQFYLPYYGKQPNNYRMPAYIRMDIGYSASWHSKHAEHNLVLGIYNVLNRHNPFMITYDKNKGTWMDISLFPILPNFSYRVSF